MLFAGSVFMLGFFESLNISSTGNKIVYELIVKLLPTLLLFALLIHDLTICLYKIRVLYMRILGITNVIF